MLSLSLYLCELCISYFPSYKCYNFGLPCDGRPRLPTCSCCPDRQKRSQLWTVYKMMIYIYMVPKGKLELSHTSKSIFGFLWS